MSKTVKKQILEGKAAIKELMREELAMIAESMITQIVNKGKRLIPSKRADAIKDINTDGVRDYQSMIESAMSVISLDALEAVRKEVPAKKNVRLSEREGSIQLAEFDRLPPSIQKRIKSRAQLITSTQMADLEKAIYFQYLNSYESTDSWDTIQHDMVIAAEEYIVPSTEAGAGVISAESVNGSRKEFFFNDDVIEEIEAFQFVNGDPVSPICEDLAGTIFSKDDPNFDRYWPPLHWNCKSYVVPILNGNLKGREITELNPSKKGESAIQFSEGSTIPMCACSRPYC